MTVPVLACVRHADRVKSGTGLVVFSVVRCCHWTRCWCTSTSWTKLLTTSLIVCVEFDISCLTSPTLPLHWNTNSSSSVSNVSWLWVRVQGYVYLTAQVGLGMHEAAFCNSPPTDLSARMQNNVTDHWQTHRTACTVHVCATCGLHSFIVCS